MNQYPVTQQQLISLVDHRIVPGISYCLFNGADRITKVVGDAAWVPAREPLHPGMQYDLASLTKVVGTVPVIQQLMQHRLVSLDDPVTRFLPMFSDQRVTVRNLLTHTSGLHGYIPHRNQLSPQELTTAFITQQRVDDSLNRQIRYADVNFLLLGWIIEQVLGTTVADAVNELVTTPLGMMDTGYHPTVSRSVPTEKQPQRGLIRGQAHDPKGYILGDDCGCAGLFSTLEDLVCFGHHLIATGLNGRLSPAMVEMLFTDQTPIAGKHSRSLGWKLLHSPADGHLLIAHTGFTGTWIILDRQEQSGMVVLTNRVHPTANNQRFLTCRDQIFATYLQEQDHLAPISKKRLWKMSSIFIRLQTNNILKPRE